MRDGLGPKERSARLAGLFADHPDEAPQYWSFVRQHRRKNLSLSSVSAKARSFIGGYRLALKLSRSNLKKAEMVKWAKGHFPVGPGRNAALADIEEMFTQLPTGALTLTELTSYFGTEYNVPKKAASPIKEAIEHARGVYGGKRSLKNPPIVR